MSRLRTLMAVSPNPNNACSYYRGIGELFNLRKNVYNNLDISVVTATDWWKIKYADAVFMERPYSEEHLNTILHAQAAGLGVWCDYDDLLTDVPTDNPCFKLYNNPEMKDRILEIISRSNHVSFSTEYLRNEMGDPKASHHYVIPNGLAHDQAWVDRTWDSEAPKEKVILWRGSNTHQRDLMTHSRSIVDAANKHPNWKFVFIGWEPWFLMDYMPNCTYGGGHSVGDYFIEVVRHNPDCILVPLVDCPFNRAKSNIAGLEGAWLTSSNVIAPNMDEWKIPGWINYTDPASLGVVLERYMRTGYDKEKAAQSREYIGQNFDTSRLTTAATRSRIDILSKIMGGLERQ